MNLGRAGDLVARSNLTPHQLVMWLADKLHPETALHTLAVVYDIAARVDVPRFRQAFQAVVEASDALRTVIEESDGAPHQRVLDRSPGAMEYVDLSVEADPEGAATAWARARAARRFQPEECLWDAALLRIAETRFRWFLHVHHVVFDGASALQMARVLTERYRHSLAGDGTARLELPRFAEYVRYARDYERSAEFLQAQAYWRERLTEEVEPLLLYGERPQKPTTRAARLSATLDPERLRRLEALAAGAGRFFPRTTLFNIFVALVAIFLHRIGGATRFCLGVPFHNRRTAALRDTLGLIMQVLPLPVRVEADDSFRTLLKRVEAEAVQAWQHAQHTIPSSRHQPVYDVVLNFHSQLGASLDGVPLRAAFLPPAHQLESLALHVHDLGKPGTLTLDFDFHADVFPPAWRALALRQFLVALDAVLDDPERPIAEINLLSEEDRALIRDLNGDRLPLPPRLTVPILVEAQAARTPGHVAVVDEGATLTYGELNARANRVARELLARGVKPEAAVGVLMHPSLDIAVTILGLAKAGAACVLLDPDYPRDRLTFMLDDAGARLLVTERALLGEVPWPDTTVLCLDRDAPAIARHSSENVETGLRPDHLAYVAYTSGSTGAPKGVMVTHRSLCSRLLWGGHAFRVGPDDCYLQNASFAYDAALWALLEPWFFGGRVALTRAAHRRDPRHLVTLMAAARVTFVATAPALLRLLLEEDGIRDCTALRRVFSWGEALAPELAERFFERLGWVELYNAYGQTETCIDVTHWRYRSDPSHRRLPIGKPNANVQVHVLDIARRPAPLGVPGELYVGGSGVARGYLNRPDLTAERFVPDPFGAPGARLFRTGDRARVLPDGTLEYLARLDRQIKVRGHRVELGEVEALLRQHPAVRRCVVVARGHPPDRRASRADLRLVAYVVAEPAVPGSELRALCRRSLPAFMIPAAFVQLDTLPQTSSGKVDEGKLPQPDEQDVGEPGDWVEPRSLAEAIVAGIWADVLGVYGVSVDSNFFDLGGDSLGGILVMSGVEKAFGIPVPTGWLIEAPTVAALAERVGELRAQAGDAARELRSSLVAIRRAGTRPPFYLVPGGAGGENELLVYARFARHLDADQPFFGLRVDVLVEPGNVRVEELARRCLHEIRRLQPHGPYVLGGECFGGLIAFEMAQQLHAAREEVARLVLLDTSVRGALGRTGRLTETIHGILEMVQERLRELRLRGSDSPQHQVAPEAVTDWWSSPEARAYLGGILQYRPRSYAGAIELIVNEETHRQNPTLGWKRLARGGLRVHPVPGDHTTYIREHARTTAERLGVCLRPAPLSTRT